jgi:hypothetical protein
MAVIGIFACIAHSNMETLPQNSDTFDTTLLVLALLFLIFVMVFARF